MKNSLLKRFIWGLMNAQGNDNAVSRAEFDIVAVGDLF